MFRTKISCLFIESVSKDEGKLADVIVRRGGQGKKKKANISANKKAEEYWTKWNHKSFMWALRFLIMKGDVTAWMGAQRTWSERLQKANDDDDVEGNKEMKCINPSKLPLFHLRSIKIKKNEQAERRMAGGSEWEQKAVLGGCVHVTAEHTTAQKGFCSSKEGGKRKIIVIVARRKRF
jgi:hypothetical protein